VQDRQMPHVPGPRKGSVSVVQSECFVPLQGQDQPLLAEGLGGSMVDVRDGHGVQDACGVQVVAVDIFLRMEQSDITNRYNG